MFVATGTPFVAIVDNHVWMNLKVNKPYLGRLKSI